MGKKFLTFLMFFVVIFLMSLFLGLKNTKAIEPSNLDVKINEIMFSPNIESTGEFIELYNSGENDIDLTGWYFADNISTDYLVSFTAKNFGQMLGLVLKPGAYALIIDSNYTSDYDAYFAENSQAKNIFLTTKDSTLGNALSGNDKIDLFDNDGQPIDNISWSFSDTSSWKRYSYEKNSDDNLWYKSMILDGTPGIINSTFDSPTLFLPADGTIFIGESSVKFSWEIEDGLASDLIVSKNEDLSNPLEDTTQLDWGKYYWEVEASKNGVKKLSEKWSFTLQEPVYSDKIIINEIMANPSGDEASNEWIELYNNSSETVNLKNWILEDTQGTIHRYIFDEDFIIGPFEHRLIYRSQSGIILNNDNDGVILYQPNGNLLDKSEFLSGGKEGWSWARGPDGAWSWTTTPTAGLTNIISLPKVDVKEEEKEIPINTVPIEIKTGDYQDYENKLVKVTGKVTSTSGNTFYLDDGSGEVKIYIQEKTGIDKPEMHKNDIFEVTGIVDLYGKTWRILPQKQDDIKLIESAAVSSSTSTTKKTTAKKAAASSTSATAKNTLKTAKAAETSKQETEAQSENIKTPFWIQLTKAVLGLMAILLILLIVKVLRSPKPITIGGHFGDDET